MQKSERSHWIREQQMVASLGMISSLCARQCRAIAAACLRLRRDPIYEDVLEWDAGRLALIATKLLEDPLKEKGAQVLELAVTRKLLLQILDRKEVVIWLARDHPETLSILLAATDFDSLSMSDPEGVDSPPAPARERRTRGLRSKPSKTGVYLPGAKD